MKKRWVKFILVMLIVFIAVMTIAPTQIFPSKYTTLTVTVGECGETSIWVKDTYHNDDYILEVSRFDGTSYVPFQSWSGTIGPHPWEKTFTIMLEGGDYKAYFSVVNCSCDDTVTFTVEKCYGERTHPMTCYQVWINEDNNFEFIFWWVYYNNNWVQIFDMEGNLVWETDFPKDEPQFEVDLPDGMYKVQTFHEAGKILQEFYIGKPGPEM